MRGFCTFNGLMVTVAQMLAEPAVGSGILLPRENFNPIVTDLLESVDVRKEVVGDNRRPVKKIETEFGHGGGGKSSEWRVARSE